MIQKLLSKHLFKDLPIDKLVNISFVSVISFFLILLIFSQIQLSRIENESNLLTSLRVPTAKASSSMNTSLQASLAALRGWMLIEEKRFLRDRKKAWRAIRLEEQVMIGLSKNWTNSQNKNRLDTILTLLNQLEEEQTVIELIAHRPENIRSNKILFETAIPLASSITNNITKLIDFNKSKKANASNLTHLAILADFRGSFVLSLADIRAFLLSADPKFRRDFNENWKTNEKNYKTLINSLNNLPQFEQILIDKIKISREEFSILPQQMFNSRTSDQWNQANYLLKTTAVKTANETSAFLNEMVFNQNHLLEAEAERIRKDAERMKFIQNIFLVIIVLFAFSFSMIIKKKYDRFIRRLNERNLLLDQNVLMATYDNNEKTVSISNAFCRQLGGIKQDFLGEKNNFFLPVDTDKGIREKISKLLKTGQGWQGEFLRTTQDGENMWLSSNIIPINNDGNVSAYHNILQDITDRKELEEVSITDKLTSLYNRRKFDQILDHEIKLAKRQKTYLTLAIMDIDFFKKYNDHYGHPAGDAALVRTASAISTSFSRPNDFAFRIGGEEFAVIFNGLDEKQSWDFLERVRENVQNMQIEHSQNEVSEYVSISIGAKVCPAELAIDKDTLYNEADKLLYTAKQKRNAVTVG